MSNKPQWRVIPDADFVSGDGRGGWWIDFGNGRANRVYDEHIARSIVDLHE